MPCEDEGALGGGALNGIVGGALKGGLDGALFAFTGGGAGPGALVALRVPVEGGGGGRAASDVPTMRPSSVHDAPTPRPLCV